MFVYLGHSNGYITLTTLPLTELKQTLLLRNAAWTTFCLSLKNRLHGWGTGHLRIIVWFEQFSVVLYALNNPLSVFKN